MEQPLLSVEGLSVAVPIGGTEVRLVEEVGFHLNAGETLGLVGESGCGKSLTAFSILDLLPSPLRVASGTIAFGGRDLLARGREGVQAVRGREITVIFQEPGTALNPVLSIGTQIGEVLSRNRDRELPFGSDPEALLKLVNIPSPAAVLRRYPFQLSGGMKQRVMIAMAAAPGPSLIVADEPTTALDATTRLDILDLLHGLSERLGTAVLLISHDVSLLERTADRIAVMYAGRLVESGPARAVVAEPAHPYTRGLLACLPTGAARGERLSVIPGNVPRPEARPSGCAFRDRCDLALASCAQQVPAHRSLGPDRWVACPVSQEGGADGRG